MNFITGSVIISEKGLVFRFHASIGALVLYLPYSKFSIFLKEKM